MLNNVYSFENDTKPSKYVFDNFDIIAKQKVKQPQYIVFVQDYAQSEVFIFNYCVCK